MRIECEKNNIVLYEVADFNLAHIFECGQCFRWNKQSDGSFTGVAKNKFLKISEDNDGKIVFHNTTKAEFDEIWYSYFDFNTDYSKIKSQLEQDKILKEAIPFGSGIRILKQDLWETVVSFIISASNNIPRIKKIVELLCENFGEKRSCSTGYYYTFPGFKVISSLTLEELSVIRAGFRDKYILSAAKMFSSGEISEEVLYSLDTKKAKELLMSIPGIGNKVSDCILLFGLSKTDTFPIDVWVKRIMETLYFKGNASNIKIEEFATENFGDLKGIAQQYLFFYARENLH